MMHKLINFADGLRLVVVPMRSLRSVTLGVWCGTGSSQETDSNNGISHFIEHMLFKGTSSRSAYEIADYIDSLGAQINAFTSKECTCYYTKSIDEHVEKCAEILSDIYFDSQFAEEELKREQGVVCEEISMTEDNPEDLCHELLSKTIFDGSPLGRSILGTAENVKAFDKAAITGYMDRYYTADNTVIVAAGNITKDTAKALVEKYFLNRFNKRKSEIKNIVRHDIKSSCVFRKKDIEQANIAISFPSFRINSPESNALSILSNLLGGCMSSRLFQKVREELGLCYSVYTYPSSYKNNGTFSIFTATNPSTAEKAVKAIKEELEKLLKGGIKQEEFLRGKEQIKSALILAQESTSSVMNAYGKLMTVTGELFDIDAKISAINALKMDEVNALLPVIFDFGRVCTSYVGKEAGCDVYQIMNA